MLINLSQKLSVLNSILNNHLDISSDSLVMSELLATATATNRFIFLLTLIPIKNTPSNITVTFMPYL
jgi:hypothetical protein